MLPITYERPKFASGRSDIRDLLGHVNVTTTEIYLRENTETKRKALESAYMEAVTQHIPAWGEDTDLLNWLQDFCR